MFNAIRAALAPTFVAPPEVEEAVEDSPASTVDVAAGECAPEPGEFVLVNKTALTVNALPVIKAPAPPEERSEYQVEEDLKTEHVEARVVEPEVAGHAMRTEDDIRRERARTARAFARGRITVGQQKAMQHLFNGQKRLVLDLPKKIARALLELKGAEPKN